jgi:hypothetical protein
MDHPTKGVRILYSLPSPGRTNVTEFDPRFVIVTENWGWSPAWIACAGGLTVTTKSCPIVDQKATTKATVIVNFIMAIDLAANNPDELPPPQNR